MREPLLLAGHQTRPLMFEVSLERPDGDSFGHQFSVDVVYRIAHGDDRTQHFHISLEETSFSEAQRFTYLHPSNIVSYAILRPPPLDRCASDEDLPVIAVLHGAGLAADSLHAREMLDASYGICAWMLFPSGVTSWSGDDWRKSSLAIPSFDTVNPSD